MSIESHIVVGPETSPFEAHLPEGQQARWPDDSVVLYIIDDDRVLGRIGMLSFRVIEGTYADESVRGTTLPYRMFSMMEQFQANTGASLMGALAQDGDDTVKDYLLRLGFERVPVEFYTRAIAVKKEAA